MRRFSAIRVRLALKALDRLSTSLGTTLSEVEGSTARAAPGEPAHALLHFRLLSAGCSAGLGR
jgi:hypothetical protein